MLFQWISWPSTYHKRLTVLVFLLRTSVTRCDSIISSFICIMSQKNSWMHICKDCFHTLTHTHTHTHTRTHTPRAISLFASSANTKLMIADASPSLLHIYRPPSIKWDVFCIQQLYKPADEAQLSTRQSGQLARDLKTPLQGSLHENWFVVQ